MSLLVGLRAPSRSPGQRRTWDMSGSMDSKSVVLRANLSGLVIQCRSIGWRRDVTRGIGRRRSCIGRRLGGGIRGRTNHGTNRDASRDAAPVWSGVVVAVAAPAAAGDVHVPTGVYVRIPVDVGIPVGARIPVNVRCVPMKIVAVEIAATVSGGGALAATAARPLPPPAAR